VRGDKRLME